MQHVGTVDLRDFEHGGAASRDGFSAELGRSLVDTGFVKVGGHGIAHRAIQDAYDAAAEVFALPEAVKARYERSDIHGARGFIPFGKERAKDASVTDLKEFWHIGPHHGGSSVNVWPDEVPAFRPATTALFGALDRAAQTLLTALSVYLGLAPSHLPELVTGADSLLRVLHYPALKGRHQPGAVRAAAHEDINFITLLPAATDAGLELKTRSGEWMAVDGADGEIVADSGDMLSRYLNGRIPSTTHRVVNPDDPDAERYSMPFFCQPRGEVLLAPPPGFVTRGEVVAEPITAGAFHRERMEQIRLVRS